MSLNEPVRLAAAQRRLLNRLGDGEFHSGHALAAEFRLSTGSVWKHVKALQELGIAVHGVTGKGYRLAQPLDLLDPAAIRSKLPPNAAAALAELHCHDIVSSTNAWLMDRRGLPSGTVCLAESQTAGRGRLGRHWVSPFGAHVYLSVLWRFAGGPKAIAGLSLAVGVGVANALQPLGFANLALKWPNDIWLNRRKLGGILLEASGEAHGEFAVVVGIGLNVRMPTDAALDIDQPWTDLASAGAAPVPARNIVAAALLGQVLPLLAEFEAGGLTPYRAAWDRLDALTGHTVTVAVGDRTVTGLYCGISADGLLRLATADGTVREFASGEVRVRMTDTTAP